MYCPVCGAKSTQGLKFCKRCGSNLNQSVNASEQRVNFGKFTGMFWAIALFSLGGLGLLVGAGLGVVGMGQGGEGLAAVIVAGFLTILLISAMLVRQLSRIISIASEQESRPQSKAMTATSDYGPPQQLSSPPPSVSSVTEHTTRNFELAQRESRLEE
jgi:predicted lipid-binding transport protein (Tim44 family)